MERWRGRRFLDVLGALGMADELKPGRRAVRDGRVLGLSVSTSLAVALVRGESAGPERARIAARALTDADWTRVEAALAGQARYAALLLAGHLPADVESVFTRLGLALFPASTRELSMDCTCRDWQVPCRHLAAACHALADAFDADPFTLLVWRGRGRDDLLAGLRERRTASTEPEGPALADALDGFWDQPKPLPRPVPRAPATPDAVLDRLPPLGLRVRGEDVTDLLRPAYRAITGD